MRDINCERKAGHLSIWFCDFPSEEAFTKYFELLFCVDNESDFDPRYNMMKDEYQRTLQAIFVPENDNRPFESIFREHYSENCFNRFSYDFGVTFDQDFWVGNFSETRSEDFATVLGEWADDYLVEPIKLVVGEKLPRAYNGFFAISSCIYNGYAKSIKRDGYRIDFLGVAEEDTYSDELSAEYNG